MAQNDLDNVLSPNLITQTAQMKLLRFLIKLSLRVEISGLENIPATGPLVAIINHIAFLDPVVAVGSFPRLIIPMT